MTRKICWALTPGNVAAIGAIDDFYDLYTLIQQIYERERLQFIETHGTGKCLWPMEWDKLCMNNVRKVCESIMNKYLPVFADGYTKIFANVYGFSNFTFLRTKQDIKQRLRLIVNIISISEFLVEIQYAVTRIIHNWRLQTQKYYVFERLFHEINDYIFSYVQENSLVNIILESDPTPINKSVLYIYENLSSTSCRLKSHPIIASRFVSSFSESEKISIPVHYCSICNKHFIGKTTLALFEKNYGKLLVQKRQLDSEDDDFSSFNKESQLYQLGYNLSDGCTDGERQRFLITLLEKGCISYLDMVRCIELNIKIHQSKPNAVIKWKRDLKYIGDYILKTKSE